MKSESTTRARTIGQVIACGLAVGFASSSATAEAPSPALERFEVQLWPDYDRPAALVMYRARLAANTALPAEVSFRIPAAVGEPHAVAYRGQGDQLMLADHTRELDGEWATIRIRVRSRDVQLEYYAPIVLHAGKRMVSYTWPGDMAVQSFVFGAQQPAAATSFEVTPAATQQVTRNGLTLHTADLGAVERGREVDIQITYESSGALSAADAAGAADVPGSPGAVEQPARSTSSAAPAPMRPATLAPAGDGGLFLWLVLGLTAFAGAVWVAYSTRR